MTKEDGQVKSEKESKLKKFKKDYSVLQKKHNLPSFEELNEDFYIERIAGTETEIIIREIRRLVGDKIVNYMRFVENLINPVNVPMFVFSMVKTLDAGDKKKLSDIYKELTKNEISFIERDIEFNEEKDAEFIRESYVLWQNVKKDLLNIIEKVKKKEESPRSNNNGYFG